MQQALARKGVTDDQLAGFSTDAADIVGKAGGIVSNLTPRVTALKQQIDELGPPPGKGEPPEAEAVAANRAALQKDYAEADGLLKRVRLTEVRAGQVESDILAKRRDRFVRSLTKRSPTLFSPTFWQDAQSGAAIYFRSLGLLISDAIAVAGERMTTSPLALLSLFVQLALGVIVFWYLRRLIRMREDDETSPDGPPAGQQVPASHHVTNFIRLGILPALLLIYFGRIALTNELVITRFDQLLATIFDTFAVFFIAMGLARVFLQPARPRLRIAALGTRTARSVFATLATALFLGSLLRIVDGSIGLLAAPLEVSVTLSAALALVCVIASLTVLFIVAGEEEDEQPAWSSPSGIVRWNYVRPLIWVAIALAAGGLAFGYIALAEFVSYQLVIGLIAIGLFWLTMRWIDEIKQAIFDQERHRRGRLARATSVKSASGRQFVTLGFGLLRLAVFLVAVMALLLPWGVQTQDWLVLVKRAYFGFQIGDLTISISAILMALFLFLVGATITRAVQHWLSAQFLPTTNLDTGLRTSITTIAGYVGIVLAAVLAIGATGLDLSNLALVAGALSVGIGLGLQSIVNNFVSGLILLAERPIKAGDWVITGGGEGMVRRISVRSTEIETFDKAAVIVPNSTLISESLTNWTHKSKLGRIIITVGVSYSSDPEQVRQILLDCADKHPLIQRRPEPMVYFMDFGSDALIFDLRCWVADILDGFNAKSDLRFAIFAELRAAGVEIPFPQRDLHIRSGLEALTQAGGSKAGTPQTATHKRTRSARPARPRASRGTTARDGDSGDGEN